MNQCHLEFEQQIQQLLADPAYQGHPMHFALAQLWLQHKEQLKRLERITHMSDGFQSMARASTLSLQERFNKQLRQLEKLARISDRYQLMMRELNTTLKEASTHDPLTGLANRRLMVERLKAETERSERLGHPFCIAMLDIDRFKQINDGYGHDAGDVVLVSVARSMSAELREYDLCGRWGGEEFILLLPELAQAAAIGVLDRLRDQVGQLSIEAGGQLLSVTISSGLAQHRVADSFSTTISRADSALLQAKRNGRNRGEIAPLDGD